VWTVTGPGTNATGYVARAARGDAVVVVVVIATDGADEPPVERVFGGVTFSTARAFDERTATTTAEHTP
jgi:hypothetical protein